MQYFGPKIRFLITIFVNRHFVALAVAVVMAPWEAFSTFRFRVRAVFVASGPENGHFCKGALKKGKYS